MSVCQPRLVGNVLFSAPNRDIAPIFVQIPLTNEHLFYKLSVCLSVMLQKALLLIDVFILVYFVTVWAVFSCCL